jgi:hypothetical protein
MSIRSVAALAALLPVLAFAKLGSGRSDAVLTPAAAEKIDGAFGYRLGEVFVPDASAEEVTTSILTDKALPGALYRVRPAPGRGSDLFSSYYILRTLKTHQIAAIYAAAPPACQTDDSQAQALAGLLTRRHAPSTQSVTLPLQIQDGARQLVLQCTERYLKLVYADTQLAYTYAREAAEIEMGM